MNTKILRAAVIAVFTLGVGRPAIAADDKKPKRRSEMVIYDNALAPDGKTGAGPRLS